MESSTSSAATTGASQSQPTGDLLWKYVTKIAKSGGRSGNAKIKCNFCNFEFTGSYSRVKAHLMRIKNMGVQICSKITPEIFSQMQRELAEEEERRKTIEIPLPPSSQTQSCSSAWGGENKKFDTLKRKATDINNQLASGGSGGSEVVVVPHRQHEGLFIVNTQLCTKNFIPGEAVADETLFRVSNEDGSVVEYRVWDPSRSKLEAVILVGLDYFSVKPGVKVLYLGADSFATVSHLSDIVGTSGMVYAVTSSPCKELSDMAIKRTYVRLINEDPSNPSKYRELVGNVDVMLSEIPLDCQVQMMAVNASYFLKVGGHFVVSFQAKHLKFGLPFTSREVICVGFMRLVGARLEPYQEVYIERHVAYYVGAYKGRAEVGSHTMDKQKYCCFQRQY